MRLIPYPTASTPAGNTNTRINIEEERQKRVKLGVLWRWVVPLVWAAGFQQDAKTCDIATQVRTGEFEWVDSPIPSL